MFMYRTFFAIDIAALFLALFYFFTGIGDGSITAFNIALWLGVLAAIIAILAMGYRLKSTGHRGTATTVLAILAVPAILAAAFVLSLLIAQPNWH
ncbi:osmoprotectant transporter permease [Hyphomicrobium methylovorum]|uniref:osmoprotectant transporter permease n=1 Tax=Hyphomicrobium methylovorum TaxID=84 RepID=UPI0015E6CC69|nr:osmoprotectant transporter permease [Hyphomicrobium methylovorum]MBA2127100.1 osmoprotectant transporter permease [Hyphomicrobium methylovorum]